MRTVYYHSKGYDPEIIQIVSGFRVQWQCDAKIVSYWLRDLRQFRMGQEAGLQLLTAFAVEATDCLDHYEVGGGCIITPSRLLCTSRLI
jgi:hypothetical protein